nr:uncharacterized protein LOC117281765 [Nicotiana tomentosiformis]
MTRIMSNAKFAIEIIDGSGHFGMWQIEVLDVLFQQGLDIAIEKKKPDNIGEEDWKIINRVACGIIRSYLAREQKYPYTKETFAKNGIMRICSGALVVMKGIRRNNNMYHYHGSTIIGTTTVTSSDDKEAEATKLWHMRLGHAGGKSLKIL